VSLWRGLLVENATQAVCAALLREKLRELPTAIAHVHDEIILVASNEDAETVRYELKQTMETCPNWAKGLPLRADPQIMTRYGK
jgi:DNA polymerase I-like protein with 3'-5' exonuclease and polymerase domains